VTCGAVRPDAASLIERLLSPACYAHATATIELLETHISWVLLAGDYDYKIKKPVSLGFVDFSTLAARRACCEEELRVNRRTAPMLYLDVVPITGNADAPVMDGEGPAIEYAVRMRRFAQEALLDRMARQCTLLPAHVDSLARTVAEFHGTVARAAPEGAFGTPAEILDEVRGNFVQFAAFGSDEKARALCDELRAWTGSGFASLEEAFACRKREGFVRECHGDLHLGNVTLVDGEPVLFDAIEFNQALRWIDVMSDIAFALMDLHRHGLPGLAHRLLDAYLCATGDYAGLRVLRFYLVYRAMVRAKVACIRLWQPGVAAADRDAAAREVRAHLDLAQRLSRRGSPALIAMHGLSGSGKTTASQYLLEALGAIRVRSDVERKRLHGLAAQSRTNSPPGDGLYTPEADRLTFARLAQLADECLAAGYPVIVDATFLARKWREFFRDFARERGAPFVLVACAAPKAVLRARLESRRRENVDASEADLAVLDRQIASLEPLATDELDAALIVDATEQGDALRRVAGSLARRLAIGLS
jgi:aminoglycoside phosphotransferase family enzyme/predicted kinase